MIATLCSLNRKENYLILEIFFPLAANDNQVLDAMVETVNYWKNYLK